MKKLRILIAVLACVGEMQSIYASGGTWTTTVTPGPSQKGVYVRTLADAGCSGPCPISVNLRIFKDLPEFSQLHGAFGSPNAQ